MNEIFIYQNCGLKYFPDKYLLQLLIRCDESDDGSQSNFSLLVNQVSIQKETILYTAGSDRVISDLQAVGTSGTLKIIWREYQGVLYGPSECHYAEVNQDLEMVSHQIISSSDDFPESFVCLRGIIQSDYLIVSCIETIQEKVVVASFNSTDLTLISAPLHLNEYEVNAAYLLSSQPYSANIQLINDTSGSTYLQFLLASGTLRVCTVSDVDSAEGMTVSRLFDFALDDIGYHHTLLDEKNNKMVVVFSGQTSPEEDNAIYIAGQNIFFAKSTNSTQVEGSVKISQSKGSYWRPDIIVDNDNYLVAWEGDILHYTVVDTDFEITTAENTVDVTAPGNIILYMGSEIYFSCQEDNIPNRYQGKGYSCSTLNADEGD